MSVHLCVRATSGTRVSESTADGRWEHPENRRWGRPGVTVCIP